MDYKRLCESDYRFMSVIWDNEPVSSTKLVELCARELQFLDQLPQLEVGQPAPVREEARVEEIGENVLAAFAAQQAEEITEEIKEEPVEEEAPVDDYPTGDPFAREDLDATRRINLDDLKFGRNYTGE